MSDNPFSVYSPEGLDAEKANRLFVEVFSDFPRVEKADHCLIIGPRGCGKSMMFRCLRPDVVMLRKEVRFDALNYLSFHISLKNSELNLTEFAVLERGPAANASGLINETFLILAILSEVSGQVVEMCQQGYIKGGAELANEYFHNEFVRRFALAGMQISTNSELTLNSVEEVFREIRRFSDESFCVLHSYLCSLAFADRAVTYQGGVLSYSRFLLPLLSNLKSIEGFPKGSVYLLLDDADNLSLMQTRVLNSWIGTRSSSSLSLKVSSQTKKYKTFTNLSGGTIDAPHDYYEVNVSDLYTTSRDRYSSRVREIVGRRLRESKISAIPEEFFPGDTEQEAQIDALAREILSGETRGYRPSDDALRYARPEFIKRLGGDSKSRPSYSYAGFDQLVHLSSGIVRYFLDSAAQMYDKTSAMDTSGTRNRAIPHIPVRVQDQVVREVADYAMFKEFAKLRKDERQEGTIAGMDVPVIHRLRNLIISMGNTFYDILVSERSERRVFSIALSQQPTDDVMEVLDFGVQTGYLHEAAIGRKDGAGRTYLYILNRRLAPHFKLDPTGFAGYLFVTNDALVAAMQTARRLRMPNDPDDVQQLDLFEEGEDSQ